MLRLVNGLILIALALWVLLLATGWAIPHNLTLSIIRWFLDNPLQSVLYALAMIGVGLVLIRNRQRQKRKPWIKPVKINLQAGQLRIDQSALHDLLRSCSSEISGLTKSKFSIQAEEDGMVITVYCQIADGYDYSLLTRQIQEKVRNLLEQDAGIKVKEVKVSVMPWRLGFPAVKK